MLTGISRFAGLSANIGRFRAKRFSWQGHFVAVAIGNGRQAGGGVPLCPDALVDDGLFDLTMLPDRAFGALGRIRSPIREGAAAFGPISSPHAVPGSKIEIGRSAQCEPGR